MTFDKSILKALTDLAHDQLIMEQEIENREEELKYLKAQHMKLSATEIPALMDEAGVSQVKLESGEKITVKDFYAPKVLHLGKFHDWLREENLEDLIKNEVKTSFGKGEDDKARELVGFILSNGGDPIRKEAVHPSTLKAWAKERIESGGDYPQDYLEVNVFKKTVIK